MTSSYGFIFFLLAGLFICFLSISASSQAAKDCFEIKHFDYFSSEPLPDTKWGDDELTKLLESHAPAKAKTNFLIPLIVWQLRNMHPNCGISIDKKRFEKLVLLYLRIRGFESDPIQRKSIADQLEFIRRDFYSQLQDDQLLPYLGYSMDDGPLYGVVVKTVPRRGKSAEVTTAFGKVLIRESKSRIYVQGMNKKGIQLWSRILTGVVPNRFLKRFDADQIETRETSVATVVSLFVDGERLNLYQRPNGRFVFYTHSW